MLFAPQTVNLWLVHSRVVSTVHKAGEDGGDRRPEPAAALAAALAAPPPSPPPPTPPAVCDAGKPAHQEIDCDTVGGDRV